jgi:uncharacterized protein (UPF0264 family)
MKVLVSPKDVEEAKVVIRGHADIIDVKNPKEGSLGANFPWVIRAIKDLVEQECGDGMEMSATIGDFDYKPGTASLAALGAAVSGADYIKVGLYKIKTRDEAIELLTGVSKAVKGLDPAKRVVCAFYSDYQRINSISPFEIAQIGPAVDIDVAMVDTGIKDCRSTLEFLSEDDLRTFVSESRALGLMTAVAGALTFADLPAIKRINPDILGVRGMVCGGDRAARVRAELVRELKRKVAE